MAVFVRITDHAYLFLVNDLIHDSFFDVADISLNREQKEVTVVFAREESEKQAWNWLSPRKKAPVVQTYLRIRRASEYRIQDTEGIGRYDFNVLEYVPGAATIVVRTGIPLDFEVTVEGFEVVVEVTEQEVPQI